MDILMRVSDANGRLGSIRSLQGVKVRVRIRQG